MPTARLRLRRKYGPSSGAFVNPIGIPTPPLGITDTWPTLPSPWTSSTANFYYVKQGGVQGANGWPASPRGSFPASIPAGAVVVLDNTVSYTNDANPTLTFTGTSGARSWLVSSGTVGLTAAGQAQIKYTGDCGVMGDWFLCDGIDFFNNNNSGGFYIGDWDGVPAANNCCLRNGQVRSNASDRGGNGGNAMNTSSNVVIWNMVFRDQGSINHINVADEDCHGLSSFGGDGYWILDSQFYHNQGDGIQVNGGAPSQTSTAAVDHLYIGRCLFYENYQTGCWLKNGQNVVISQCESYGHTFNSGSAPINMGGQYGFNNVWWLFNYIHDGTTGFGIAGSNGNSFARNGYFIGNVVVNHTNNGIFCNSTLDHPYFVGNTIYGYHDAGITSSSDSALNATYENNIFQNRTLSTGYDIETESTSIPEKVKRNIFPASPRFNLNGNLTTSVASMESADSTNRSNNAATDPQFVNPGGTTAVDYKVQVGSPAINTGALITDVYTTFFNLYGIDIRVDYANVVRPQGGAYDKGAFER